MQKISFVLIGLGLSLLIANVQQISIAQEFLKGVSKWAGEAGGDFQAKMNTYCPDGNARGLSFERHRKSKGDLDYYGFVLLCRNNTLGERNGSTVAGGNSLGRFETKCDSGTLQGLEFERYRKGDGDVDTYRFRAICSGNSTGWAGAVEGGRASGGVVVCPGNEKVRGMEIFRFKVGNGDLDLHDFQLTCG